MCLVDKDNYKKKKTFLISLITYACDNHTKRVCHIPYIRLVLFHTMKGYFRVLVSNVV